MDEQVRFVKINGGYGATAFNGEKMRASGGRMVPRHRCRCREEPVHASQIALLMLCGALLLGAGCASLKDANDTVGGTVAPEPGTPAYYEQKIRGFFALDDGRLVPIRGASGADPRTVSGVIRPATSQQTGARWIEGRVVQVISNQLAVVGTAVTNASGAVTFPRSCLVVTANDWQPAPTGLPVRVLAVPDGRYTYFTESGDKGTLPAYREVVEPSYDAYREIYERDLTGTPDLPIISVGPAQPPVPAVLRAPSLPTPPPPALAAPREPAAALPPATPTVLTCGPYTYTTNANGQATITGFEKSFTGTLAVTNALGGCPVTAIAKDAFAGCRGLSEVTLPDSLITVGDGAFNGCGNLTRLLISETVTAIGVRAFQGCHKLVSLTIPASVATLKEAAFEYCHSLTNVHLPAGVTVMGGNPFGGCSKLEAISVDPENPAFTSDGDGVVFNKDRTELIAVPATRKGTYAVPPGITNILRGAFLLCNGLTDVEIPSSVKQIGACTFFVCSSLRNVTLAEGVERIGMQAFESCGKLESITLPASVRHLESWTFRNASGLRSVRFLGDAPGGAGNSSIFNNCPEATVYRLPGAKGWGETFGGRPVKVWGSPASRDGTPTAVGSIADLKRSGAFGFPQASAQVLCDTPELRVSFWSDAKVLVVQVVVWQDCDETLGTTSDGRQIGDNSTLCLDVDTDQQASPNTDRNYSLNPWPQMLGMHYQVTLGPSSWTGLKGDTKGRGAIRYVSVDAEDRIRVDTYAIPLEEIGKQPGECIRLAYWARSQEPKMTVDSVGFGHGGAYYSHHLPRSRYHDVVLGKSAGVFNFLDVPNGKDDMASATPVPAVAPKQSLPTPVNLQVGDSAPPLTQGKYVQGDPVGAFEKGKVYVIEFWATWCGPCRTVIPHVNKLQEKYKDKGLVVIGQNVWQRGEDVEGDVAKFVGEMGADMAYRVALDRDGAMAESWMKAAGRKGIPSAFVVDREGKIAWIGHPSTGLDEAVEVLLGEAAPAKPSLLPPKETRAASNDGLLPGISFTHTVDIRHSANVMVFQR